MVANRVIAALALLTMCGPQARAEEGAADKVAAGRTFASRACGKCHLVALDGSDASARRPPASALAVLAQRPAVTESALRKLLVANHHNFRASDAVPNHTMSDQATDEVVAYVLSLKAAK